MSRNYKFHNKLGAYFVSFATVNWIDVFTRQIYFDVLAESIEYCRKHKGMEIYAYCIMPSHVHFIFRSINEDPSGLLRDFKRYTSRRIIQTVEENPQESKQKWLLWMFKREAEKYKTKSTYQFWQHHNKPIELWSEKVIQQKIEYIHQNPVESGFVLEATEWKYSSARNYANENYLFEIDI